MSKMPFAKIGEFVKKSGSLGLIAVVVIFGVILLLLPSGEETAKEDKTQAPQSSPEIAAETEAELERRIAGALSKIEGAGRVTVLLTLQSDGETHLATDREFSEKAGGESREQSEETVIMSSGSSVQSPVIVKRDYPEYRGALIVAEGADDPTVKLAVTQAVMSLTGLSSERVTVVKMQKTD